MTDYNVRGFALRFQASRPLDEHTEQVWTNYLRAVVPSGPPIQTALDLGAGTGRFWAVLRGAWDPETIVALDQSSAMLEAAENAEDVEKTVLDIDDPTLSNYRAEAVFCSMVLHYSKDPLGLCKRLRAVLPPHGVLCVRTASSETISANAVLHFFPSAVRAEMNSFPQRAVIEQWLKMAGFQVRTEVVGTPAAPSYSLLLRRAMRRGLPSLQLVPKWEFAWGALRLGAWVLVASLGRREMPTDKSLLIIGVPK